MRVYTRASRLENVALGSSRTGEDLPVDKDKEPTQRRGV